MMTIKKRYPNIQQRFAQYLSGLPINIYCYNDDIIDIAENWHGEKFTKKKEMLIVNNWFNFLAFKFIQLAEKYGYSID